MPFNLARDERSYYDAVSEKIQLEVNKFLKKGTMSGVRFGALLFQALICLML